MKNRPLFFSFIVFFIFFCLAPEDLRSDGKTPGRKIAEDMDAANRGFKGENAEMQMILVDAYGTRVTRLLKGRTKEMADGEYGSLLTFLSPSDVRGTKMLTRSKKNGRNDQWLYLPALKREKRISSRNRSGSFMGSEFSYKDLELQMIDEYDYRLLREERYQGHDVWVLKQIAKKRSAYLKQIVFVSKKYLNPLKTEYYDHVNRLFKVAYFIDYKQFQVGRKKMFRPSKIHMKNILTRKESIFVWTKRTLGVKWIDREFSKSALQ
ncbi:MAG: outer membrane lipoprotein-sorting protein [Halobacteriovoraceae bacterium]|nr:outer membrane lipoprotein-sorting protein [Halobacteriovoraceae bacterium]